MQKNKTQWLLFDANNKSSVLIDNFVNLNNNNYIFTINNISNEVVIKHYYDYNILPIELIEQRKKNKSFNDINKNLESTEIYEEPLVRNKKYRINDLILDEIVLENILLIKINNKFLSSNLENNLLLNPNVSEFSYFIEIKISDELCKLYNYKQKRFIKYDLLNDLFTLDNTETNYNNIDMYDDINIVHIFKKELNTEDNSVAYKLFYSASDTYLNFNDINTTAYYNIDTIVDIEAVNLSNDYCNSMCYSNSEIEDKLINNKNYLINSSNNQLFITLGEYYIKLLEEHVKNKNYFKINTTLSDNFVSILLKNFKEYKTLQKMLFNETINLETQEVKVLVVTVDISSNPNMENLTNIILWNNNIETIGRFENKFDKPLLIDSIINKNLKVKYDSNFNKFDFSNDKSFVFTSYKNPPSNKKYVKLNNLTMDIIQKFKISLFHFDNAGESDIEDSEKVPVKNKLSNIRKLYTTCSWGDCDIYDDLKEEDLNKIKENLRRFEITNSLRGGSLDNDMIRILKVIDNNEIDFYRNSNVNKIKYVNNNLTYYDTNKLEEFMFKENDSIELFKIFGDYGWKNSYNSMYHKTLFRINKVNNIKPIDYYDTFRNIYPVSWILNKYSFNKHNLWKADSWFEDEPHYRSLPFWKFELVQISEKSKSNTNNLIKIIGGNTPQPKKNNSNYLLYILIAFIIYLVYLQQ